MSFASYQFGTPDGETPDTSNLVSPEDRSITIRTGGVVTYNGSESSTVHTHQSVNLASVDPSGGLQARTKTGSPRYGELQPSDIIKLPSGETTVQVAESLGLIERDQHGRFVLVPDGAERALASEQTQEAPQDDGEALSDLTVETDFSNLVGGSTATTQFEIIGQVINDGEINPGTIGRAASELGIAPQELNSRLGKIIEGFQSQAVSTFNAAGIEDPDGFISWAEEHRSREFKAAKQSHAVDRSTKGYQPLVQEYLSTIADRDPQSVMEATFGEGVTATKQGNTIILNIHGRQVDFKTAVREGLVTVRGA